MLYQSVKRFGSRSVPKLFAKVYQQTTKVAASKERVKGQHKINMHYKSNIVSGIFLHFAIWGQTGVPILVSCYKIIL